MQEVVPGYNPAAGIMDPVWLQEHVFDVLNAMEDCYRAPSPTRYA
jgi:hypothetical protein